MTYWTYSLSSKEQRVAARNDYRADSLRARLNYDPKRLAFGTSGRRGAVIDLTQLEVYINALAELQYLQSLPAEHGGIARGDVFYYAFDLRPSSTRFAPEEGGRGEIAQAIERAIRDAGMVPVNLGPIPTPALTSYAIERTKGSVMITGSHIPFERNGYKVNTSKGELMKSDEAPIGLRVEQVREQLYRHPFSESPFNERGMFKAGHMELGQQIDEGREAYIRRYLDFFAGENLGGCRVIAYQHSAVGRDILVEILTGLGAEVAPAGRTDTFVPIDTEAIDTEQLHTIFHLIEQAGQGSFQAVVSTDGDSDRPLILAPEGQTVKFFGGDLVGMVVAEFLGPDSVVVPISCNDAVDLGPLKKLLEPKTRIGSPFVIAGMSKARARGKQRVCGWEANGGFLTGSDFKRQEKILKALPTRDAMLPILAVLFSAREKRVGVAELFSRLPARYSKAALIRKFPRPISLRILERFSPADPQISTVIFDSVEVRVVGRDGGALSASEEIERLCAIRSELALFFTPALGFGEIVRIDYTDGVRVYFSNRDVAHVRPSGNADELRIYAVADSQERADQIARYGVDEPAGILRQMEREVSRA